MAKKFGTGNAYPIILKKYMQELDDTFLTQYNAQSIFFVQNLWDLTGLFRWALTRIWSKRTRTLEEQL